MWLKLLSTIVALVAKWFGVGQPDPEAQGEVSGKAQEQASQALEELHEEDVADSAAASVSGGVRDHDSHERTGG